MTHFDIVLEKFCRMLESNGPTLYRPLLFIDKSKGNKLEGLAKPSKPEITPNVPITLSVVLRAEGFVIDV
jgi:hypothetical protein